MDERSRFVGLDVHKATIAVAVAEVFGDPEDRGQIANAELLAALQAIRGIGFLNAVTIVAEAGDLRRFATVG